MRVLFEECSYVVNRLDFVCFVDVLRYFGYLELKYWEFFKGLRENFLFVVFILVYVDKINLDIF